MLVLAAEPVLLYALWVLSPLVADSMKLAIAVLIAVLVFLLAPFLLFLQSNFSKFKRGIFPLFENRKNHKTKVNLKNSKKWGVKFETKL